MNLSEVVGAAGAVALFFGIVTLLLAAVGRLGGGTWRDESPDHLLRRSPQLVVFWFALRWWRYAVVTVLAGVGLLACAGAISAIS